MKTVFVLNAVFSPPDKRYLVSLIFFSCYFSLTLIKELNRLHFVTWCCLPKTLASHNSMQRKDDKVSNKTAYKQERQRKKRERETKIEIDSQKRSKFWLLRMREKQKNLLRQISRKICLFSCKTHF